MLQDKEGLEIKKIGKMAYGAHRRLMEKLIIGELNQEDFLLLNTLLMQSIRRYSNNPKAEDRLIVSIMAYEHSGTIFDSLYSEIGIHDDIEVPFNNYMGVDINEFQDKFKNYLKFIEKKPYEPYDDIFEYFYLIDIKERDNNYGKYESPIEEILGEQLREKTGCKSSKTYKNEDLIRADLNYQVKILNGKYRVDFLLTSYNGKPPLIIECDGHDFHEKTKEQARRDKKRDRECVLAGYAVMRFTGSEIYNNVEKCISDIESYFSN